MGGQLVFKTHPPFGLLYLCSDGQSLCSVISSLAWADRREVKWSEVAQSCPTLCDPMDCSLPGSSVHGIFQARGLEWGAVAFSIQKLSLHQSTYCYLTIFIHPTLPPPFFTTGNCYSVFCIYVFNFIWFSLSIYLFIPYMNEITQYLSFSISLISLQIMPSQTIHTIKNSKISSFYSWVAFHHIHAETSVNKCTAYVVF